MKILFVSTLYVPYNIGGAEATVRMLAEETVRRGDEAVVVTLTPEDRGSSDVVGGVRVIYLPLANVYFPHGPKARPRWLKPVWQLADAWNPVMARRVSEILEREQPDVVNIHNLQGFSAAIWGAVAARGIPIVQTLHDYYVGCLNSSMYRNGRNCARQCAECRWLGAPRRRLSTLPRVVTAVSHRMLVRLRAAGLFQGVDDIRVIRGANLSFGTVADRRVPAPGRPVRFGFLGRLEPVKGLGLLLDAVSRLPDGHAELIVAGRGEPAYEAALRAGAAALAVDGRVQFAGFVQAEAYFRGIDILVVPSLWEEPLGRIVHEALGFAVPVIGAELGGIPEIVEEGRTGFLFRAGDAADLARVMRRVVEEPVDWAAMFAACRREAEVFRFDRIFGAYQAAWRDAAGQTAAQGGRAGRARRRAS